MTIPHSSTWYSPLAAILCFTATGLATGQTLSHLPTADTAYSRVANAGQEMDRLQRNALARDQELRRMGYTPHFAAEMTNQCAQIRASSDWRNLMARDTRAWQTAVKSVNHRP